MKESPYPQQISRRHKPRPPNPSMVISKECHRVNSFRSRMQHLIAKRPQKIDTRCSVGIRQVQVLIVDDLRTQRRRHDHLYDFEIEPFGVNLQKVDATDIVL